MNDLTNLIEEIKASPDYQERDQWFVSVYRTARAYGGPEEGGWWYDVNEHEGSASFASRAAAEAFLEQAEAKAEARNRKEAPERHRAMAALPDHDAAGYDEGYIPTGWHDGGKYKVLIERTAGEFDNTNQPRPHYE
jgi:hypothetical protein